MLWSNEKSSQIGRLGRRQLLQYGAAALGGGLLASGTAQAQRKSSPTLIMAQGSLEKISFGTNWYAQAEHGGFYQALATDIYREHGLDVTIQMGGPGINVTQLLVGGAVDTVMGASGTALSAVEQGIPTVTVASMFQKNPQIILAHPDVERFQDLRGRPIYISRGAQITYWPFLVAQYNFTHDQTRPYNFNPGPFLADPTSAQQGFLTSEPFAIEQESGFRPRVFLLADYGYNPYSCTIETTRRLVETEPDRLQRFVDASIKGWYSFLEDPRPAFRLIQQDNPNMTNAQLAYSHEKLQEYGIIKSGDAIEKGIGAMTHERWQTFFDTMTVAGVYPPTLPYQNAYTLDFVNKGTAAYQA